MPSSNFLTGRSKAVLLFWILFVLCLCHTAVSVPCSRVVTGWERADLLAPMYVKFIVFCHCPIQCPGSGVVLDCIDS